MWVSPGGCQADAFGKPGLGTCLLLSAAWRLSLCWNMILGVKTAVSSRDSSWKEGLAHGLNVAPEFWMINSAPLPSPHGFESQTTCGHYLGETRPELEWVEAPRSVRDGEGSGTTAPNQLRASWERWLSHCGPDLASHFLYR